MSVKVFPFLLSKLSNSFLGNAGVRKEVHKVFSSTYKAAVIEESGKPFKITELKSQKKLKKGQARIKVKACSLNSFDYLVTQGQNPTPLKYPVTVGYEITGQVLETNECTEIAKGDKVLALNKDDLGGLAEEVIVNQQDIWLMPNNANYIEGAAIADSFGTAYLGLVKCGHLKEKEIVLITMAPGHGYAPLDLAAQVFKAKVIAVSLAESENETLRQHGAWSALAYDHKQLTAKVAEHTKKKGVSLVYDTMAGHVLQTCFECVSYEGHIVIAGYTMNEMPPVKITSFLQLPMFSLCPVSLWSHRKHSFERYREAVSEVIEMYEQNLIKADVSHKFKLEDVQKAVDLIKTKQPVGKVIIQMD